MPLHCQAERMLRQVHCFRQPVRRGSSLTQAFSQSFNPLVMITVYVNLLLPDRKEQRGILCQTDCVGRLVVGGVSWCSTPLGHSVGMS